MPKSLPHFRELLANDWQPRNDPSTALRESHTASVEEIRSHFPILKRQIHGKPLCFLDNGASAQKPQAVIDALTRCYSHEYANIHRGVYRLSEDATAAYEAARQTVADFINAKQPQEIVFTRNATEAINLIAHSYGRTICKSGDAVIISQMEHHSNIIPWQMLRDSLGIELRIAPISDDGQLMMEEYRNLLDERVQLVAITHVSNVLGTVTPVQEIIAAAHNVGAKTMIDGSQAAVHMPVDVQALDADFYVFTGHKIYGPSGIGVLYAKNDLLHTMPPFLGGGDMIESVSFERAIWAEPPSKFEAGTPPIAEAAGLKAALDYVSSVGFEWIIDHEKTLLEAATERLKMIPGLTIQGQAPHKASVVSFTLDGAHPSDIATLADLDAVAIRSGHHCAEPLMTRLGLAGTVRASFALYNSMAEVETLGRAIEKAQKMLRA